MTEHTLTPNEEEFMKDTKTAKKVIGKSRQEMLLDLINAEERPGYKMFLNVLYEAYFQTAHGKGIQRHGFGEDWTDQPIMTDTKQLGPAAASFQVVKKSKEACGMAKRGEYDEAKAEILGSIVYAVSQYCTIDAYQHEEQ